MDLQDENRINIVLDNLRHELNEIRNADVLLLKQLLSIHNTIQELLRRRTMKRTQSCHNCGTSKSTCMLSVKTDDLIHRDYSSPSFCTRSNSCISLEEFSNQSGMFYLPESDDEAGSEDSKPTIKRKDSSISQEDMQKYSELLTIYVREWKTSNSIVVTEGNM